MVAGGREKTKPNKQKTQPKKNINKEMATQITLDKKIWGGDTTGTLSYKASQNWP